MMCDLVTKLNERLVWKGINFFKRVERNGEKNHLVARILQVPRFSLGYYSPPVSSLLNGP